MDLIDRITRTAVAVVIVAAVTAMVMAGVVATIDHATGALIDGPKWVRLAVLPIGLVASNLSLRLLGKGATPGAGDVFISSAQTGVVDLTAGRGRLAALLATLAAGLPLGTEGPAVFVGSMVAGVSRRAWRHIDSRVLIAAAAAGGAGFVIGSWAAGAAFVVEAPWRRGVDRRRVPAAVLGGLVGWGVARALDRPPLLGLGRSERESIVHRIDGFSLDRLLVAGVAIGFTAAVATRLWVLAFRFAKREMRHPLLARIGIAASVLVAVTVLAEQLADGDAVLVGTGESASSWASGRGAAAWVIVLVLGLRIVASSFVQFAGGVGGVFVPSMVPGLLAVAALHDVAPAWFPLGAVALGGVAALGAGYGVPLTAVAWLVTGGVNRDEFTLGLIALVVAWWPNRNLPITAAKISLGSQTERHE